jgi:WD40 repeat protein
MAVGLEHETRGYMLSCSKSECQVAISFCGNVCFGVDQCKRCISNYPQCNTTCADDLFNQNDYVTVNGFKYLLCDDTSPSQVKGCGLHCRGLFFSFSECTLLNDIPICRCSSLPVSSTSTFNPSTTTLTSTGTTTTITSTKTTTTYWTTTYWNNITLYGHTDGVNAVVVLKNGDLASASNDASVIIWDSITYKIKLKLTGHSDRVWCLTVLPNGYLISGGADSKIKIWDIETGALRATLTGHSYAIRSLAVLQSGNLASASDDRTVRIWDPNSGSLIRTLTGHSNYVYSLVVLKNGHLASGGFDNMLKIWNASTGALIKEIDREVFIWTMLVLNNGDLAIPYYNEIDILDTNTWTLKKIIQAHYLAIFALASFPNGNLASTGEDKIIKIWNQIDGSLNATLMQTFSGHTSYTSSLAVINNNLLASASWDRNVKIWKI